MHAKAFAAAAILFMALFLSSWDGAPGEAQTDVEENPQVLIAPRGALETLAARKTEEASITRLARLDRSTPAFSHALTVPHGIDLDVTYINRSPMYQAYCDEYTEFPNTGLGIIRLCPGTENEKRWPEPGEVVTFTAHIINKGTVASGPFDFIWFIDDTPVLSDTHAGLAPAAEGTATYAWPWAHTMDGERLLDDHSVRFTVDPEDAIVETYESNNSLQDRTDALSFVIGMTPEMYDAYNVPITSSLPFSAEDWLQKQIAAMNKALADSVYPVTPQGATVRVRMNSFVISDTLPTDNRQHDGAWIIKSEVRNPDWSYYWYDEDIDWGLVHELSHQIGLIDLYTSPIDAVSTRVLDRQGFPSNFGFDWPRPGVMFGGDIAPHPNPGRFPHYYSSHSAGGISSTKGYRNNFYGTYQYDIPEQNTLLILDSQGNPAADVQVALYQRTAPLNWVGLPEIDNVSEISGTTGLDGRFLLPNRDARGGVTNPRAQTLRDNPFGVVDIIGLQNRFLLELTKGQHEEFHWMDITQFNLAYWMGNTLSHTFTITSHVPPPNAPAPPELTIARVERLSAELQWTPSPSPDVVAYRVYRAAHPEYLYQRIGELTGTRFEEDFEGDGNGYRVYVVTAVGADGLESGFSNAFYAPHLGQPRSVALAPDGSGVVLDPDQAYPLVVRQPGGRYSHALGSTFLRLGNSRFLSIDGAGSILVGDAGNAEFPPSARVFDSGGNPLLEFGQAGSDPGQFATPSGVAWWGPPCTFGGPYTPDEHTLLLLHLDGDASGAQGESGAANGVEFTAGRHDQGAYLDASDTLTYTSAGNLNHTWGAVEFWVRVDWDGDDGGNHDLFWWADDTNRLHLRKDEISNLVFDYFYSGGGCGAATNVGAWRAGEWHHLAFTWAEAEIGLFVDGRQVERKVCAGTARPVAPTFFIGSGPGGVRSVEATIDELRISDVPRLGNSNDCARILVADSGNHRIQAFDYLGNWIAAYGGLGSGVGQFNTPQGLAVDPSGRVIVVDQGNDRLQVLSFDGTTFGYLDSLQAGFEDPTGIAVDAEGNIGVADTGNNRVVVFGPGGDLRGVFAQPNDGHSGTFYAPHGVAIEADGDLVVADTGNGRVVNVRVALPRCRIWLPLTAHNSGAQ